MNTFHSSLVTICAPTIPLHLRSNPSSRKRKDYLQKACDLMMKYKSPDTVCGTVAQIARDGETAQVMTLKELRDTEVDMFTTVFVGNSQTKNVNGKMVTTRI